MNEITTPCEMNDTLFSIRISLDKAATVLLVLIEYYGFDKINLTEDEILKLRYNAKNIGNLLYTVSDYIHNSIELTIQENQEDMI